MKEIFAAPISGGNWTIKIRTANGPVGNKIVGHQSTLTDMLSSIQKRHPTLTFPGQDEAEAEVVAAQMAKLAGVR